MLLLIYTNRNTDWAMCSDMEWGWTPA